MKHIRLGFGIITALVLTGVGSFARANTTTMIDSPDATASALTGLIAKNAEPNCAIRSAHMLTNGSSSLLMNVDDGIRRPVVTGFTPTTGTAGTTITVTGSHFTGATIASVGGYPATFTFVNDTTLTVVVPPGAKTGSVHVKNPGGLGASKADFTVIASSYGITSFTPVLGPVGTVVTVTGSGFSNMTAASVDGYPAPFTMVNDTTATLTVPTGAGTGKIHIKSPAGLVISPTDFTVPGTVPGVSGGVAAAITGFTPATAGTGQTVTVTGTGFTNMTAASIDGYPAKYVLVNDKTVKMTVPPRAATGVIHIKTGAGIAASATNLAIYLMPTIASFSPTSGSVGSTVTITGTNFEGLSMVSLDGLLADFTVTSDTTLTFKVPDEAVSGVVHVTNPTGYAAGPTDFTVSP
jgi:large repetitive protein